MRIPPDKGYTKTNENGYHCEDGPAVVIIYLVKAFEEFYLDGNHFGTIITNFDLAEARYYIIWHDKWTAAQSEEEFFNTFQKTAIEYKMFKVLDR